MCLTSNIFFLLDLKVSIQFLNHYGFLLPIKHHREFTFSRKRGKMNQEVMFCYFFLLQIFPKLLRHLTCYYTSLLTKPFTTLGRLFVLALELLLWLGKDRGHGEKKPTLAVGRKQEPNSGLLCWCWMFCWPILSPQPPPFVDYVALF